MNVTQYDVAIIGGGMGGVAATLAAARAGARVILTESTPWIGGQMTSQGVSAFDEHADIESFGGTRSYVELRNGIRNYYCQHYGVPAKMPDGVPLNPGNGWVSRLCFEPKVGLLVIEKMLAEFVASGQVTVLLEHTPIAAEVRGNRVEVVTVRSKSGTISTILAQYFLDATELGDLLSLTGTEYVTGAESQADTGEPHALPDGPRPEQVQSFTYTFAVEYCPGEVHIIPKPEGYEYFRETQPYTLILRRHDGSLAPFQMFTCSPEGNLPFWTYRRLLDGHLLDPARGMRDITMINWPGNDYDAKNIIDRSPEEQSSILDEAKRLALGFLYWLQTEAPRNDPSNGGGDSSCGYPELRLMPEVMNTLDGLSMAPYIRESRRIVALERVVEQDIVIELRPDGHAKPFNTSVGVGWYPIDIHNCAERVPSAGGHQTFPFQIPLGALIPRRMTNLIAACKNIGTTHITNGAYRLHPVEWNIGESAGNLATFCIAKDCTPHQVWASALEKTENSWLRQFQAQLSQQGVPLKWKAPLANIGESTL